MEGYTQKSGSIQKPGFAGLLFVRYGPMACTLESYSAIGKHHQTAVNVQRGKGNTEVS